MTHIRKYWLGYLSSLVILIVIILYHYTETYTVDGIVLCIRT